MLVKCIPLWYVRGWALQDPPKGTLDTPVNLNSWILGVADRGPPGTMPKFDKNQMVDDGITVAPSIVEQPAVHVEPPIATMIPDEFKPCPEVRAAVERGIGAKEFEAAFKASPSSVLAMEKPALDILAATEGDGVGPFDLLWAAREIVKNGK